MARSAPGPGPGAARQRARPAAGTTGDPLSRLPPRSPGYYGPPQTGRGGEPHPGPSFPGGAQQYPGFRLAEEDGHDGVMHAKAGPALAPRLGRLPALEI